MHHDSPCDNCCLQGRLAAVTKGALIWMQSARDTGVDTKQNIMRDEEAVIPRSNERPCRQRYTQRSSAMPLACVHHYIFHDIPSAPVRHSQPETDAELACLALIVAISTVASTGSAK